MGLRQEKPLGKAYRLHSAITRSEQLAWPSLNGVHIASAAATRDTEALAHHITLGVYGVRNSADQVPYAELGSKLECEFLHYAWYVSCITTP